MDFGISAPRHAQTNQRRVDRHTLYHAHWYINPLMFWLEVPLDDTASEKGVFDVAYLTQTDDPLWR